MKGFWIRVKLMKQNLIENRSLKTKERSENFVKTKDEGSTKMFQKCNGSY